MNIAIRCRDNFYTLGLQILLTELFTETLNQSVPVFYDYQPENIPQADLYVLRIRPGEQYLCHAEMQAFSSALIVGLVEAHHAPARGEVPFCMGNMLFIPCAESVTLLKEKIKRHWLRGRADDSAPSGCRECPHKTLTEQQYRMTSLLLKGLSSREIGERMAICPKTVLSHRHSLMRKFRLKTDYELVDFMRAFAEKRLPLSEPQARQASGLSSLASKSANIGTSR